MNLFNVFPDADIRVLRLGDRTVAILFPQGMCGAGLAISPAMAEELLKEMEAQTNNEQKETHEHP